MVCCHQREHFFPRSSLSANSPFGALTVVSESSKVSEMACTVCPSLGNQCFTYTSEQSDLHERRGEIERTMSDSRCFKFPLL